MKNFDELRRESALPYLSPEAGEYGVSAPEREPEKELENEPEKEPGVA